MGAFSRIKNQCMDSKKTDNVFSGVYGAALKNATVVLIIAACGCSVSFSNSKTTDDGDVDIDAKLKPDATLYFDAATDPDEDGGGNPDANDGAVEIDAGPCGGNCTEDEVCVNGECCAPQQSSESNCDNGVDDDCDGQTDCGDSDCGGHDCDDGNNNTINDACDSNTGTCVGDPCTWVQVCEQCPTGECRDVLIHEDPGCGCASSVVAPNCDMTNSPYDVPCGGGYYCTYERRRITEDCNCHNECQP